MADRAQSPTESRSPHLRNLISGDNPALDLNPSQIEGLRAFRTALSCGELSMHEVHCVSGTPPDAAHLIACRDRYGLDLQTYLCPKTGLMWTSPSFDAESVARFYSDYYRLIYTGSTQPSENFVAKQQDHGREILEYVKTEISHGLVFDVGCGVGATVMPFKESGWDAIGCDYGEEFIKSGRALGLELYEGNYSALRHVAPCDLLIGSHVIEHALNPIEELRGWCGLIREGGYLYIEVPGIFLAYADYRNFARFLHVAHTYHFTLLSLRASLAPLGMELVKGDESVRALFRKVETPVVVPDCTGLAAEILGFLDKHETLSSTIIRRLRRQSSKLLRSVKRTYANLF